MSANNYKPKEYLENTQRLVSNDSPKIIAMLPQRLSEIVETEMYKQWPSGSGKPFETFAEAALAPQPWGIGLGQFSQWIRPSQLDSLCSGYENVRLALRPVIGTMSRQVAKRGRPKTGEKNPDNVRVFPGQHGNDQEYLLRRLSKDAPEIYAAWEAGKYASVRAAAIAGGIVKPKVGGRPFKKDEDPVMMVKKFWKRATDEQREELRKWFRTNEAKG